MTYHIAHGDRMSTERLVRLTCDRCGASSEIVSRDDEEPAGPRLGWVRLNYANGSSHYKDLCEPCCEQVRAALDARP